MGLLSIDSPGEVFSGDPETLKAEFDKLALRYHPDLNHSPTAHEEFVHLQLLYQRAQEALAQGFWETSNTLRFSSYRVRFFRKVELPIGYMYVGSSHVTFLIEKSFTNLYENAVSMIKGLTYKTERMKKEMARFLPSIRVKASLTDYNVLVLHKTPDLILLKDVPTTIPNWDKHVAWIMSSLYNLRCYFEVVGITHNDISLDTYFVSPEYHSGVLLGGWWYSRKQGQKLLAVPSYAFEFASPQMTATKKADYSLDKELIRLLGRQLLKGGAPRPVEQWLKQSTSVSAVDEYALWNKVLEQSYGKKRFIPMEINLKDIYGG